MFEAKDNPASPLREYEVPREARPSYYLSVFGDLEHAAQRAKNMYLIQRVRLDPVLDKLDEIARDDKLARNPYTIPDDSGRFVYMHQHPEFEDDRRFAQEDIRRAARMLNFFNAYDTVQYLNTVANGLDHLDRDGIGQVMRASIRQKGDMSFLLAPVETERRKIWWEGYLGFVDSPRTSEIQQEMNRFRQVAQERSNAGFNKETLMRFEYAAVMAGRLGRRLVSAKNSSVSGDNHVRIAIFSGPFWEKYNDTNIDVASQYVAEHILPTYDGSLRFLCGHEFSHNEDDPSKLGELTQPMRESAANFSAIDLAAKDVELNHLPEDSLVECIMGAVGYSLSDCDDFLRTGRSLPDVVTLGRRTVYDLGSTTLLYKFVSEGGLVIQNGVITSVDPKEVVRVARDLYEEESDLMQSGNYGKALKHFENNLPRGPFSLERFNSSYAVA